MSNKVLLILSVLITIAFLIYAIPVAQYTTPTDDGGISFRYAERLSEGKGFSYNDDENVNGSSNPLYVLSLALANTILKDIRTSSIILGLIAITITVMASLHTLLKYQGWIAGLIFVFLFSSTYFLLIQYFDGLESGFSCALISLLFLALYQEKEGAIGMVLGLMLANKLDSALATIAFTTVFIFRKRRFPIKPAVIAILSALPIALILLVFFGNVVPHSMISKLIGPAHNIRENFDNLWLIKLIMDVSPLVSVIFILSLLGLLLDRTMADIVLFFYFALYLIAYSTINLGDNYPWYGVVPLYIMIIIASINSSRILNKVWIILTSRITFEQFQQFKVKLYTSIIPVSVVLLSTIMVVRSYRSFDWQAELHTYEKGNLSRAAAGAWLRKVASNEEILLTGWGLPAFEYKGNLIDFSGLTSRFDHEITDTIHYAMLEFTDDTPLTIDLRDVFGERFHSDKLHLIAIFRILSASEYYAIYASDQSSYLMQNHDKELGDVLDIQWADLKSNNSELYGNKVMEITGNNIFAHAPFDSWIDVVWREDLYLSFVPELSKEAIDSDGAIFRVSMNNSIVYERDVYPGDNLERVSLPVLRGEAPTTKIRFETIAKTHNLYDWAWFKGVFLGSLNLDPLNPSDFSYLNERQKRELKNLLILIY